MTGINKLLLSATGLHCKPTEQPSCYVLFLGPGGSTAAQRPLHAARSAGTWLRGEKGVSLTFILGFMVESTYQISAPHLPYFFIFLLDRPPLSPSWSSAPYPCSSSQERETFVSAKSPRYSIVKFQAVYSGVLWAADECVLPGRGLGGTPWA